MQQFVKDFCFHQSQRGEFNFLYGFIFNRAFKYRKLFPEFIVPFTASMKINEGMK